MKKYLNCLSFLLMMLLSWKSIAMELHAQSTALKMPSQKTLTAFKDDVETLHKMYHASLVINLWQIQKMYNNLHSMIKYDRIDYDSINYLIRLTRNTIKNQKREEEINELFSRYEIPVARRDLASNEVEQISSLFHSAVLSWFSPTLQKTLETKLAQVMKIQETTNFDNLNELDKKMFTLSAIGLCANDFKDECVTRYGYVKSFEEAVQLYIYSKKDGENFYKAARKYMAESSESDGWVPPVFDLSQISDDGYGSDDSE